MEHQEYTNDCTYCLEPINENDAGIETDDDENAWHVDCAEFHKADIGRAGMALLQYIQQTDPSVNMWEIEEEGVYWDCWGTHYYVLTDIEADEKAQEGAQSYLDSCVLPRVPKDLQSYFDEERWLDDAVSHDGRAFWISQDNVESSVDSLDGETYYIFEV